MENIINNHHVMTEKDKDFVNKVLTAKKMLLTTNSSKFTEITKHDIELKTNIYKYYSSTNENLSYYKELPSMKGKDVLVPTASGDHAFNALLYGAKSIETFDVNALAEFIFKLKETAIKSLSKEEFLNFFSSNNFYSKTIYEKFRGNLDNYTRVFFDEVYKAVALDDDANKNRQKLFGLVEESLCSRLDPIYIQKYNPYLQNEENYKKVQKALKILKQPIKHKVCFAHDIGDHFKDKNAVFMSNILTYYISSSYYYDKDFESDKISPKLAQSIKDVMSPNSFASLFYFYGVPDSTLSAQMDDFTQRFGKIYKYKDSSPQNLKLSKSKFTNSKKETTYSLYKLNSESANEYNDTIQILVRRQEKQK